MTALPEPSVPPELYDDEYFLTGNWGHEEWAESGGTRLAGIYTGVLRRARLRPGERVVDLGTGRGELLVAAVREGAASAIGVDYSASAADMAERTIQLHGVGSQARVVLADVRGIELPDGEADLVTMVDVVEHLTPVELRASLVQAHRLLRPGGRVVVHTSPNRLVYTVTYRLQRGLRPDRWRRWPADPRSDYERTLHVNEQRRGSLRRALQDAGFTAVEARLGAWVYAGFVPDERARRLYHRLARAGPLARFGVADLWAEARRPA